jgi:E3 Ubiquitin ligase
MSVANILGIVATSGGAILFFLGIRKNSESNALSKYVPADSINSIPFGIPVVVSGKVTADKPLTSPVTKALCVYYEYILEKEVEHKDTNGNSSWEWKQLGSPEKQTIPFYLQDQHGKVLIKPENCEVNGIYQTQQFLQPGTIQNTNTIGNILSSIIKGPAKTNHDRERVTEYLIETGSTLNAFGTLTMEGVQKFLQKTTTYPLVLSPLSKDQLVGAEKRNAYILYAMAVALIILGLFLILRGNSTFG